MSNENETENLGYSPGMSGNYVVRNHRLSVGSLLMFNRVCSFWYVCFDEFSVVAPFATCRHTDQGERVSSRRYYRSLFFSNSHTKGSERLLPSKGPTYTTFSGACSFGERVFSSSLH